jgi:hypothetical protein
MVWNHRLILRGTAALAALTVSVSLILRLVWVNGGLQSFDASINKILNVDAEGNLPTWYATVLVFSCALVAFSIHAFVDRRSMWAWRGFAALLVFISVDEAASLHEHLIEPLRGLFDTSGVLYYAWVLAAIPAIVGAGIVLRPMMTPLLASEERRILGAMGMMVFGAVGFEMLSGLAADDLESVTYVLITHAEEALEFFGAVLLLNGLLRTHERLSAVLTPPRIPTTV